MFDSGIERTVIVAIVILWFASGWYLNSRLRSVHEKLDRIFGEFNGLREYLYEIDPQFDDERESSERFKGHMADPSKGDILAGMDDMDLLREKEREGRRTLNTPFVSRL